MRPPQDHQRGEAAGERQAAAPQHQRGQVGSALPKQMTCEGHARIRLFVHVCVCFVSGVRSCVSARRPQRSRWRDTRPNTWEASRGSTRGREARNTTSTSNTAARFSRRRRRPRPERSVPGTHSTHVHLHQSHVWKIKMRGADSIENILSAQFDILDTCNRTCTSI